MGLQLTALCVQAVSLSCVEVDFIVWDKKKSEEIRLHPLQRVLAVVDHLRLLDAQVGLDLGRPADARDACERAQQRQ